MPLFVHLARANDVRAIKRAGLRAPKQRRGVYAMPVLPDFVVTHQWLSELKHFRPARMMAVYFRIPDDEPVLVGPYNGPWTDVTAAQAAAWIAQAEKPLGLEVIVPRPIAAKEIHRIKPLPKQVGWRFMPGARAFHRDAGFQPWPNAGTIGAARKRKLSLAEN